MSFSIAQYVNLATYALQKIPGVASAMAYWLAIGPREGQEDSDIRTVAFVAFMKSMTLDAKLATVETAQRLAGRLVPVSEDVWGIPDDVRTLDLARIERVVDEAIRSTRPADIEVDDLPSSHGGPCLGEWEARRRYKGSIEALSARERYELMQAECEDKESVLLYFHGGAYYLGTETGHRQMVSRIVEGFGGRAFSVRYRLAPQDPFPAALTDALAAYDYLLHPPANALHEPVPASKIVLAGDSAGGNLAAALMATLIESRGAFPLPAGLALLSPWVDLTHCLPSCGSGENDYLPRMQGETGTHKASEAWPADGTQRQFYCSNAMVTHPLVSPMAYDNWRGNLASCIIQCGAVERLRDEGRYLAQHLAEEGVLVQYDEYRSMPHVFQMLLHTGHRRSPSSSWQSTSRPSRPPPLPPRLHQRHSSADESCETVAIKWKHSRETPSRNTSMSSSSLPCRPPVTTLASPSSLSCSTRKKLNLTMYTIALVPASIKVRTLISVQQRKIDTERNDAGDADIVMQNSPLLCYVK